MSAFFEGDLCGFSVHSHLRVPTLLKCVMPRRDAPFLMMDTKDTESGMLQGRAAVGLEARGGQRRLSVRQITCSVLTCACAALCVYTLYKVHRVDEALRPVERGIYLNLKKVIDSTYLNFTVTWNNSLTLHHGSEVMVPFAGPYIFYICAVVEGNGTKGNLTLSQGQMKTSFELLATSGKRCVRQQKLISLYEKEKVTFSFKNSDVPLLYLRDLRVGLHYLLGAQDFDTPNVK